MSAVRCIYVVNKEGTIQAGVRELPREQFAKDQVTIQIAFSSLNFKDTLACQGHRGVVKSLPHIPGIDLAGTVVDSQSPGFKIGDQVLVTGYDLGQGHWGGWSEIACVPADWIVKLPPGLSLFDAMFIGTAGFTAAQCLLALQRNGVLPDSGPIAVTGATGGVGSLAVRLLSQAGYEVVAVTGKMDQSELLRRIGAQRVIDRQQLLSGDSSRPMLTAQWAGAIDTVGGNILTTLLKSTQYGGCVAACGLVAGHQLDLTVYPFLLRGISLCGAASADCPMPQRLAIWEKLSGPWKPQHTEVLSIEVGLENLLSHVEMMKQGQVAGRVVVRVL
jgi:putative YhdH/YhfP family quinone oxidoreductase